MVQQVVQDVFREDVICVHDEQQSLVVDFARTVANMRREIVHDEKLSGCTLITILIPVQKICPKLWRFYQVVETPAQSFEAWRT